MDPSQLESRLAPPATQAPGARKVSPSTASAALDLVRAMGKEGCVMFYGRSGSGKAALPFLPFLPFLSFLPFLHPLIA